MGNPLTIHFTDDLERISQALQVMQRGSMDLADVLIEVTARYGPRLAHAIKDSYAAGFQVCSTAHDAAYGVEQPARQALAVAAASSDIVPRQYREEELYPRDTMKRPYYDPLWNPEGIPQSGPFEDIAWGE